MSWNSKVGWTEGLFLRPQHFQQQDRYHENNLNARVSLITPYPWGISALEIDHDLAQQGKFAVRRCAGVMPDGMAFRHSRSCTASRAAGAGARRWRTR